MRKLSHLAKDLAFFLWYRAAAVLGQTKPLIPMGTWYRMQYRPKEVRRYFGIPLPDLAPDEVQLRFTGRTTADNLRQAFSFYRYINSTCQLNKIESPKILDFGGGWGRIARFFLRDTVPDRIYISDCLSDSIHWLEATHNPCNIIKNDLLPPIAGLDKDFDVIYAFSVFSHLSEEYQSAWTNFLLGCLRPGGHLIITTRGHQFIATLKQLHQAGVINDLTKKLPLPQKVESRYEAGDFQFYSTGGGGELGADFYGETFIPRIYFEKKFKGQMIDFNEEVAEVDQAVVVLRR